MIDLSPSLITGSSLPTKSRTDPLRPHCQFVDPECLVVRHAVVEVRQHHELVELHLGEVGRAEHHVSPFDHELPIDPAPKFPIVIQLVPSHVQAVELEHRFDAVPTTMWKHLRAIILLPGIVTLVIPGTILWRTGTDTFGLWQSFPAARIVLPVIGAFSICLGLLLMVATIRLFVTVGKGTLAPWEPTQRLLEQGVYRHVRNPMISGVLFILLGESVLTASLPLFWWFVIFAVINATYIPLLEEPGLVNRFGEDYLDYKRNVPRWIPTWTSWDGAARDAS